MRAHLLLDCDPGNDDAVAILAAIGHPALKLGAVTTSAGHLEAARTARNAAITGVAGLPVSRGCEGPILRERMIARFLDHDSALDPERPDLPAVVLDALHAIDRIAEEVRAHPGLTIAVTGPLTNLALAIRRYPDIVGAFGRIVTLGGTWGPGTKSAAAEWNILCDPEAAAIVYGSGVRITMIPVDATEKVPIDTALVASVEAIGTPVAAFAGELLRSLRITHSEGPLGPVDAPLHDPCAVLLAAESSIARTLPARVDIDTTRGLNYGRTVIDFAGRSDLPNNCEVAVAFDVVATHAALVAALASVGKLGPDG